MLVELVLTVRCLSSDLFGTGTYYVKATSIQMDNPMGDGFV